MPVTLDDKLKWLKQIRRVESPNFDARPDDVEIDLVVIHGISLPPGEFGGPYIDQLFTNRLDPDGHPYFREIAHLRVSTHFLVDRRGDITQYVPVIMRAWHAGESSYCGRKQCNDFSVGIELEGVDDKSYTDAQYRTASEIVAELRRHWPAIGPGQVVGHSDVAPDRKTDPGPAFDWEHFRDLLGS